MISEFEIDSNEISRISFDESLTQKQKNIKCSKIESKMAKKEQMELDGKNTGYYN